MQKCNLRSLPYEELLRELHTMGEKDYRALQIYEWVHQKRVTAFAEMTNIPKRLQKELSDRFWIEGLTLLKRQISKKDGTNKFLFALSDQNTVESVFLPYRHGNSVCISTQVGCRMGCRFCASTLGGLVRNLEAGEMLDQVYRIMELTQKPISNVVVMGMGEPLDNYDALVLFLRMMSDVRGMHLSARNITVSTCGLAPQIRLFAKEHLPVTLALSLHSAIQKKRESLMPIAKKYPLSQVLDACGEYFRETGRRITFEYSLVKGENDGKEDIEALKTILQSSHCHLNIIPVNPVRERKFRRPSHEDVVKFQNVLEKSGINVTIRREMGVDIDGACGQLRQSNREATDKGAGK